MRPLPILAGLAAAACTTLLLLPQTGNDTDSSARKHGPQTRLYGIEIVGPGEPCGSAIHASPAELSQEAKVPVWQPSPDSGFELEDSWACSTGGAPVLLYGKMQVSFEDGWSDIDTSKTWDALVADMGGRVDAFNGYAALVHPASDNAPNNEIMFVVGDTLVRLLSVRDVSIDDMERLAESVSATASKA